MMPIADHRQNAKTCAKMSAGGRDGQTNVCVRSLHMTSSLDRILGFPGPRQEFVETVDGMSVDMRVRTSLR